MNGRRNIFSYKLYEEVRYLLSRKLNLKYKIRKQCIKTKPIHENLKNNNFTVGTELEGFKVIQIEEIPDINSRLIKLDHIGTGAQYIHIDRNDSNNVFSIAFRTTPRNSTGLPHILEHLTLMGSEKYPCRDPFFKMLNRSLATFMNAMTAPDYTFYPFATQNRTDYYNLMSVYLDAVFKPKLRMNDFKLEGWRLEHEDIFDSKSPIIFKGVVFNEMKGVFSENQNIFLENLLNNMLPSHTYGVNSGGDPFEIPRMTYQNLVDFQKDHYHPSNSRMYSYGNFNLITHLNFINKNYLQNYDLQKEFSEKTAVPLEPRWNAPRKKHIFCKHDPLAPDNQKQSTLAISYLCTDIAIVNDLFILRVLSQLLVDGPNSPFYKSLIEPNIGLGYAPATGFDSQTRDTTFTVGLQGISENNFGQVEEIIYNTFQECATNGFSIKNIENVLHGTELNLKNQGSDFGLNLIFNISSLWNHDGDLVNFLKITDCIVRFKENISADPYYLQKIVEKYFINNTHRLILTMSPNDHYEENMKHKENQLLQQKLSEMTNKDLTEICKTSLELRKEQEKKEDISCLPTLKISDINKDILVKNLHIMDFMNVPIQVCSLPTNGITYFRAVLNTSGIADDVKHYLPLFAGIISRMGTKSYDYRLFDQMILKKTGGLNVAVHVSENPNCKDSFEEGLILDSFCLDRNSIDMFKLWRILFNEVCLTDIYRFSTLVGNITSDVVNGVADSGHLYAMMFASSLVSGSALRKEQFGGLTYVRNMKEIACLEDLVPILEKLKNMTQTILNKTQIRCALNLSSEQSNVAVDSLQNLISQIPGNYSNKISNYSTSVRFSQSNKFHVILPFAVNFAAKSIHCVPFTDPDFPVLRVFCKLLTTKYLLPLIRERFGAYGAGVHISVGGNIQFYSYRDPNTIDTMNIFDEAYDWLMKNEFSDLDIDEAKLGVFRDIDAPTSPSTEGMRVFLNKISDEIFAQHRLRILNVHRTDLYDVGIKYLNNDSLLSAKVLIGPENENLKSWQKIQ